MDSEIKRERDLNLRTIMESPIERQDTDSAERKVKTLYQACMKVDDIDSLGIQPLTDVMKRFGGWALSGMSLYIIKTFHLQARTIVNQKVLSFSLADK